MTKLSRCDGTARIAPALTIDGTNAYTAEGHHRALRTPVVDIP